MSIEENLDRVLRRHDELTALLADPASVEQGQFADLSREYAELEPVVEAVKAFRAASAELSDLEEMLSDNGDPEMAALARDEAETLRARLPGLEHELQLLLLPRDDADAKNAILEIRAGTGGDEAALFAADLFRMYQRYADAHGWKFEVIEVSENEIGGFKEVTASVSGRDVFSRLKFESGVHRVQRIPVTESGGRIHTSAATVAVLPEAEDVDIHDRRDRICASMCIRALGPRRAARQHDRQRGADHARCPLAIVVSQPGREIAAQEQGKRA